MTDKSNTKLSEDELQRYKRQMMMAGWGEEGQKKLKGSTVFMVGAGGLGSPVSIYLAVAGIGRIVISDFDSPDLTNLNRQILHTVNDIGKNKAISAKETLSQINPDVEIVPVTEQITAENIARYAADADIIVDCLDNFQARHILNDYSVKTGKPLVHGGIYGMAGQLTFFHPPETGCLSCIFPSSRSDAGGYRLSSGHGSHQVSSRKRDESQECSPDMGRRENGFSEAQPEKISQLPCVRERKGRVKEISGKC